MRGLLCLMMKCPFLSCCTELLKQKVSPSCCVSHLIPLENEYTDCKEVCDSVSSLWFSTCAKSLVGIIVLSPCVIFAQV